MRNIQGESWFEKLSLKDKQEVLFSQNIGGAVPIVTEEVYNNMNEKDQQCLLNQTAISGLEINYQKLYTLLLGEEGQGGLYTFMNEMKASLDSVVKQVENLPQQISREVSAAHGRIDEVKRDVDKVGTIAREARDKVDTIITKAEADEEAKKGTWSGVKQDLIVFGIKIAVVCMVLGASGVGLKKIMEMVL